MEAAGRKEKMPKKGKEEGAEEEGEGDEDEEEEEMMKGYDKVADMRNQKAGKEEGGVKEEALRAPYELEVLKGGGATCDEMNTKEEEELDKDDVEKNKLLKDLGVKEEALRAPYELEDLKVGGPTVDSGSLHEVSCIPSSLFFPLASSIVDSWVASSHEAAMGVNDGKEKGKGKEEEDLSLKHCGEEEEEAKEEAPGAPYELENLGFEDDSEDVLSGVLKSMEELGSGERDSQEHGLQAPGALQMGSASMPLVSLSQQLFHGRQDSEQREIRLGLPSNGRMVNETLGLLKDCGLPVEWDSPQQHVATIPQLPKLRVFFQHSEEIVRNLSSGHLDIGIVGFDMVSECRQGHDDLLIVDNDLGYGHCHLSLAIPKNGIFESIISVKELAQMPQWTPENPLRVVTGLPNLGRKFMQKIGLKHVSILTADGALGGFPQRGWADVILDLVSSETKLEENSLKEIEGGRVLESQAVLVASRKSLVQWEGVRETTREILERLEAHLKADGQIMVTAYMSGSSVEEVAERVSQPSLSGLQNPAVCQVFCQRDGKMVVDCYAIDICVPEKALHSSVQQLRNIGSSRVLISPSTSKWQQLLSKLEL